jgi:hypothetical protein
VLFNNAISLKALLPKFHPPTANEVFKDGFSIFKLLNLSYLKKKKIYIILFMHYHSKISFDRRRWCSITGYRNALISLTLELCTLVSSTSEYIMPF